MSQDFVTRAELHTELQAFQQKVEQQMRTFMTEVRQQSTDFVTEVRAMIETVGREAREGRAEILDSNRSIGERISVLIQNVDRFSADVERTKNQYDRAAEGLSARVGTLEEKNARIYHPEIRRESASPGKHAKGRPARRKGERRS